MNTSHKHESMTRKRVILIGFALVVVLLAAISVVSYLNLADLMAAQDREENSLQMRHALSRVGLLLVDAETSQRGFIISGNETFLEPHAEALLSLPEELATLGRLARNDPETLRHLGELDELVKQKLRVVESNIRARRERGWEFAEEQVRKGRGKRVMDEIRAKLAAFDREEVKRLNAVTAHLETAGHRALVIIVGGSILAMVCAGFSLDQVRRAFLEKARAREAVERANADLEVKVQQRTAMLRETLQKLEIENEGRKVLEAEVLQISEREQRRIAQDLHDGLGQTLAGALHLITALQKLLAGRSAPEVGEAANLRLLMKEALEQTRATARGLYPVKEAPKALMLALQELARKTSVLFGIDCVFHCEGNVLFQNNVTATHLYRIAQEAINNAVKHGKASEVRIVLAERDGKVVLEIQDNGTGFPAGPRREDGLGTRIMNHRAAFSGGTLEIESGENGGVLVRAQIPVEENRQNEINS